MLLLEVAPSEMENLYQQVAGAGYAILLTDTEGVILSYVGDPEFTNTANRNGVCNGAVWTDMAVLITELARADAQRPLSITPPRRDRFALIQASRAARPSATVNQSTIPGSRYEYSLRFRLCRDHSSRRLAFQRRSLHHL